MVIRFVTLQGDVEIGTPKSEGRDAGSAGIGCGAWPLERCRGHEKRNICPIDRGVGGFKIGAGGYGPVMKGHDGFHDAGNARSRFEVSNLGFD